MPDALIPPIKILFLVFVGAIVTFAISLIILKTVKNKKPIFFSIIFTILLSLFSAAFWAYQSHKAKDENFSLNSTSYHIFINTDKQYQIRLKDKTKILADMTTNKIFETQVYSFTQENSTIYVYGTKGYTTINTQTNLIKQFFTSNETDFFTDKANVYGKNYVVLNSFTEFSKSEQDILKKLGK